MGSYLLRRLLSALFSLFLSSLVTFTLLRLAPGDPVDIMYGRFRPGGQISAERLNQVRVELGLDRPWPQQYLAWLSRVSRLDFGTSLRSREPVARELGRLLPATAMLAGLAFLVQAALAVILGIIAAVNANRWPDQAIRLAAVACVAMPTFWLGLLLLYLFAARLRWVAVGGEVSLRQVILPGLVLALFLLPQPLRVLRAGLLAEFSRLYLVFGRAKGLSEWRLLVRHALPNALLPVITLLGMNLGWLLGGSVIVEVIFSWPGLGKYIVESIHLRDYPVIQGYMLLATTLVISINLLVDLAYAVLDPRVRLSPGKI